MNHILRIVPSNYLKNNCSYNQSQQTISYGKLNKIILNTCKNAQRKKSEKYEKELWSWGGCGDLTYPIL